MRNIDAGKKYIPTSFLFFGTAACAIPPFALEPIQEVIFM